MSAVKENKTEAIVSWILAMLLCPLGVSFSVKGALGVSMIEAPVYVLHLKLSKIFSWYTFGTSEYVVQALLLIAMCIVIKSFKWKYLLSFLTAFIYGWILDGWNLLLSGLPADTMLLRIAYTAVGCVVVSLAVAMFFRTFLPLEVWELFVKEVSEHFGFNITKFKWIYDISSLLVGVLLMLLLLREIRTDAIGIGTVVTTFVNAPLIGMFSKLLDKLWKRKS